MQNLQKCFFFYFVSSILDFVYFLKNKRLISYHLTIFGLLITGGLISYAHAEVCPEDRI